MVYISKNHYKKCVICEVDFITTHRLSSCCSGKCRKEKERRKNYKYKKDNYFTTEFSLFQRDNFTCIYCGKSPIEDNIKLHIEHVIPRQHKGLNSIDNLITACNQCNLSKAAKILSNDIVKRILKVIHKRNSLLTDQQIAEIINNTHYLKNERR